MENKIRFRLIGRYALFTDPITKIGGEKSTFMIPTYQALKGVCESIYWKPSIVWHVDRVCILKPIQTETKGIRPIKYGGGNDLAYYTYLANVEYLVEAHFEFNQNRLDLQKDFCENKHYWIAKRSLERGGRRDIFLGSRECQGYVEPCDAEDFKNNNGCYKDVPITEFGLSFHSFLYPDESGEEKLQARFWNVKMINGIIEFPRPEECNKMRYIKRMGIKHFDINNIKKCDDEIREYGGEGDNV